VKISNLEASLNFYTASANSGKSLLQETQDKNKQLEDKLAASKQVILDQKTEIVQLRAEVAMEMARREQLAAKHVMEQKHLEEIANTNLARVKADLATMEADYKLEKGKRVELEAMLEKSASSVRTESNEVSSLRSKIQELGARVTEESNRANSLTAMLAETERNAAGKLEEMNQRLRTERDRCAAMVRENSELMHNIEQLRANHASEQQAPTSSSKTLQHSSEAEKELAELRSSNAQLTSRLDAVYAELELRNQELLRLDELYGVMDISLLQRFPDASQPLDKSLVLRTSLDGVFYVNDMSMLSVNMRALFPADETQGATRVGIM
jgi:chromosome segregation ATPase